MLGASLCWSTGGLFVRFVSVPNSWEIAFWRSLSMGIFLGVWLSFRYASHLRRAVVAIGLSGFLAGLCLAASFPGFILAVTQTTVAHTLVLISTSPFLSALFGRVCLGELVPVRHYIAMGIALTGIIAMCLDSFAAGTLAGSIIAAGVAVAFASCVILLRHRQAQADYDASRVGGRAHLRQCSPALQPAVSGHVAGYRYTGVYGHHSGRARLPAHDDGGTAYYRGRSQSSCSPGNDARPAVGMDRCRGTAQQYRHCWRLDCGFLIGAERAPRSIQTKPHGGSAVAFRSAHVISFLLAVLFFW